MRRPWIKIEICTPDKPEICSLATQLKLEDDAVVGKLVRLWSWAELNRINPNDLGVTKEFIDKIVGRKGFAQALEKTGWLIETDEKLSFRNFKRHNSPVAQNKALTAKRVARHRLRKAAVEEKVTEESLSEGGMPPSFEVPTPINKKKSPRREKLTVKPLPEPAIEAPIVEEISNFTNDENDVITQDSPLITNEVDVEVSEPANVEPVAPSAEPPVVIEKPELPPQITPEEALAALQIEEPAPRKRRAKAAPDTTDQPMLF